MRARLFVLLLIIGTLVGIKQHADAAFPWAPPAYIPCCQTLPYSTWDPAYNPSICTTYGSPCWAFSAADKTVTCAGCSFGYQTNARGTNNKISGKWHVEITADTVSGSCCYMVGLSNTLVSTTANIFASNTGVGYSNNGQVAVNFPTILATLGTYTSGDTVCIEVDISNKLIWFQLAPGGVPSGTWNAGIPGANPASGTGGINIVTIGTVNLYPAVSTGFGNGVATLNTGASAFKCSVSTGFLAWG